jgi:hypothetical protein
MKEESLIEIPNMRKAGIPNDTVLQAISKMPINGPFREWPMPDAVSRLRSHGIELTLGDFAAFAVVIKDLAHDSILKADKSVTKREMAILETARKLRQLLGARTLREQVKFEVQFMPIEHAEMRVLLNGVALSAVETLREQAHGNARRKTKGNRTDIPTYVYWLSLIEFWERRLGRTPGYSTNQTTNERGGPLVEFILQMSGSRPGEVPTKNEIGDFIKRHKGKRVLPNGYWEAKGDFARMTLIQGI